MKLIDWNWLFCTCNVSFVLDFQAGKYSNLITVPVLNFPKNSLLNGPKNSFLMMIIAYHKKQMNVTVAYIALGF